MRGLRYIERCGGAAHDGPAWIAFTASSRSGRTVYFDGRALQRAAGGRGAGNHFDVETGEPYWVTGVKKRGTNRHPHGSGLILVEASAVPELLALRGDDALDSAHFRVVQDFPPTDPARFVPLLNERLQ